MFHDIHSAADRVLHIDIEDEHDEGNQSQQPSGHDESSNQLLDIHRFIPERVDDFDVTFDGHHDGVVCGADHDRQVSETGLPHSAQELIQHGTTGGEPGRKYDVRRIHRALVNSPHKAAIMWKLNVFFVVSLNKTCETAYLYI